jgi:anti-anti-sigma regulatory factor
VGIFSIFKKKPEADESGLPDFGESTRMRLGEPSRMLTDEERARQREIARATAAKIDEIELAMTNDIFNTPEPAWGDGPRRPRTNAQLLESGDAGTLPMLELDTTELLADDELPDAPAAPQTPPVIEEIAILYAGAQLEVAEHMLKDSLPEIGAVERTVWWMLFDLYQASGRQDDFDSIAIDYASHFETSPPTWAPPPLPAEPARAYAGVTPTESLSGRLDAGCADQVERLLGLAASHPVLRLELGRVADVTPDGCAVLVDALGRLRAAGVELIVAGAAELAELLRGGIEIGRRTAPQTPWLLLLELLQLLNREKDFEETAMDYCITYEVSPPSFVAPSKVATAANAHAPAATDRFMLPQLVTGDSGPLLAAIQAYAEGVDVVLLDCSRLVRIDYAAATALLARLRPLAEHARIELRDLNHLVAALLKLLGYTEVARLFPHKY